jgi:hypothetical protein
MVVTAGPGISVLNTNVVNPTTMTATFAINADAPLGPHVVSVTTPGGSVSASAFTVQLGTPLVSTLSTNAGVRNGIPFQVVFTGNNFQAGMTISPMAGITVSNLVVESSTRATSTFTIEPGATLGTRSIFLTTTSGTSTSATTFTVADPFPDLTISSTHAANWVTGFSESYTVTVTNVGLAPTTGNIVAGELLFPALPFTIVAAGGNGWSCTWGNAGFQCQTSTVLGAGASSSFPVAVTVGGPMIGYLHTYSISASGDLNTGNNFLSADATTALSTPSVFITFSPAVPNARQQASASLSISPAIPHAFSGTLTLGFTPNAVVPTNDPAIQFATGGRTVSFTFDANTTQARIAGATVTGPIGFQTGTIAGTLSFTSTYAAGAVSVSRLPQQITIARQAPVIVEVHTDTQGGLQLVATLYSTSRDVTDAVLTFNTSPQVRLSCGGSTGCTASGNSIALDLRSPFGAWYTSDSSFGSISTLRLPISIDSGSVKGTVTVTLRNSIGSSNTVTATLP